MTLYTNVTDDAPKDEAILSYRQFVEHEQELKRKIPAPFNDLCRCVKSLQLAHARKKSEIDLLYYELTGVKGKDYTKNRTAFNRDQATERYYKLSDQIAQLESEDKYYIICLDLLQQLKDMCREPEQQEAINELYYYNFL